MGRLPRYTGILFLVLLLASASVVHASGGGGSGDESGDGNIDVYLALGAAALLGAILVFDIFSGPEGSGAQEAPAPVTDPLIEDTGVDWESVTTEPVPSTVAVSTFISTGDTDLSPVFLQYLSEALPEGFEVHPDPITLGLGSPEEEAGMAQEFFGAGYFVTASGSPSDLEILLYSGTEGLLWSYPVGAPDEAKLQEAAEALADYMADPAVN
jgi:hypothetical protein